MKEQYIDFIEKSLNAYTDENIRDFIDGVKRDGLTEHGFPRLASNIGILIANGRRTELFDTFIEIMNICCDEIPKHRAANDFSVREVCCCLMLLEKNKTVSDELLTKWKNRMSTFDPWTLYEGVAETPEAFVGNWGMFAAVSEFVRGSFLGIDTTEFVDWQIPSQLLALDENDMYQDAPPVNNPTLYEITARLLIAFLLMFGYRGKYAERLEKILDNTADLTLKMQSVTGEIPFGGRSNQFLLNDAIEVSYCELEAVRYARKGDLKKAGEFKAAAKLSAERLSSYLDLDRISHIKNRYGIHSMLGCEEYAYFNKYMITTASNLYMGYLFADDSINPTVAPCEKGGFVFSTSDNFHKTFLNAGGYFAEIDKSADTHYDGSGLGRVHKKGCSSFACLSVPFPSKSTYRLQNANPSAMSICCYAKSGDELLLGAEDYAKYSLIDSKETPESASATFSCELSDSITVTQNYSLSESGVDITLDGDGDIGFMLPLFDFDGENNTLISISENSVSVEYGDSVCEYKFSGKLSTDYKYYYNRNGRYKVYSVDSRKLHIEVNNIK